MRLATIAGRTQSFAVIDAHREMPTCKRLVAAAYICASIVSCPGRGDALCTPRRKRVSLLRAGRPTWTGSAGIDESSGVCEAVGIGAGFDDAAAESEPIDDRGAEAGVGEGLRPAGE